MSTNLEAQRLAKYIRLKSLLMVANSNSSHIGSCLSAAEIIAVMNIVAQDQNTELIFSKGHAAAAYYAALSGLGIISEDLLESFGMDASELIGHANHNVKGINFSTGSLGHGLPIGIGVAIAKIKKKVLVLMSDGELNEGTTWESFALASQHKLSNLTVIIDSNGLQSFGNTSDVLNLEPLSQKFSSFGWKCYEVNGHDISSLVSAIDLNVIGMPKVIIAKTIKGKGIKIMENRLEWHYKSPNANELKLFMDEIMYDA